jgi:AraC family transcriptional regulator
MQYAPASKLRHCLVLIAVTREQIDRVLTAIESRYTDPDLRLVHLAEVANVSVYHLSRMIKETTGSGFVQHVHARRTAAAHHLIAHSTLTVKEVAAAVGYNSATQLCRHFRRVYGITPSRQRSRLQLRVAMHG